VLGALGLPAARKREAVRVGVGRYTTSDEVKLAGELIVDSIRRIRRANSIDRH
jgi:cysteine sulfinate desulfinase/cysteine desulfurase-like protein